MSLLNLTNKEIKKRRTMVCKIVGKLPEATTVEHGAHMSLEVRGKRFGWYMQDHHGDQRMQINCKAGKGESRSLAASDPERFHIPDYVGHLGWVGFWLDTPKVDWDVVEGLLTIAYRLTAPKKLAEQIRFAEE